MSKLENYIVKSTNKLSSQSNTSTKTSSYGKKKSLEDYVVSSSKKKLTSETNYNKEDYIAKKNGETIDGLQNNLSSNGVEVPKSDLAEKPVRNWFEKYIGDPISSLQYGVARGVKNAVDENSNTSFGQGFKEGIGAGFKDENANMRTSWKDVLDTLLNSSNETTRNVTAVANNVLNPFAWNDALKGYAEDKSQVDVAKEHTGLTGFVGDAFLDPLNLVGGLGGASKILTKGSKVLDGTKAIGNITDATEVLKGLGKSGDLTKEAEYLVEKASKKLGYINDYKGITLGTDKHNFVVPGLSAKALGKLADTKLGRMVSTPVRALGNVTNMIKESKLGEDTGKLFGGEFYGVLKNAKKNPEEAMKTIAFIDEIKRTRNTEVMDKLKLVTDVAEKQKIIKDHETEITRLAELKDNFKILEQTVDVPNENRANYIATIKADLTKKRENIAKQMEAINKTAKSTTDLSAKLDLAKQYEHLSSMNNTNEAIVLMSDKELDDMLMKQVAITKAEGKAVDSQFIKTEDIPKANDYVAAEKVETKPVEVPKVETVKPNEVVKPKDETMKLSEITKPTAKVELGNKVTLNKEVEKLKKEQEKLLGSSNIDHKALEANKVKLKEAQTKLDEFNKPKEVEVKPKTKEELDKLVKIDGFTEQIKSTVDTSLEDTYKKLGDKKLNDLTDEKYNELINKHIEAKLPLDEEIKDRYKSMNQWEADNEIKFLNNKMANRRKMNEEHTITNKAKKKLQGVVDYVTELSEKAKVKPRFDLESEDFYTANMGFRNIEKARMERKLFEKGKKAYASTNEVTDRMAEQLADALTNSFKDSKWIGEAGDDLTRDLKYLTKREFDTVWDSIKKANNKPYESKRFKNYSSFNDDEKVIGKDEAVTGKNRDKWIEEEDVKRQNKKGEVPTADVWEGDDFGYVKHLMETNSDELDNISDTMKQGIIERDLNKIELDKEYEIMNKEFYDAKQKALPMTEKQTAFVKNQLGYIKKSRPDIYEIIKEEFKPTGKTRNTLEIASREQAGRFITRVKELQNDAEFISKPLSEKTSIALKEKLNKKAQALWHKGNSEEDMKLQETANVIQNYLRSSNGKITSYGKYSELNARIQKYFDKEAVEVITETKAPTTIKELQLQKEAKARVNETVAETPLADLQKSAETIEQKVAVTQSKNTIDTIVQANKNIPSAMSEVMVGSAKDTPLAKVIPMKNLKLTKLEKEYEKLGNILNDEKLFNEMFDKKYGKLYPEFTKQTKTIYEKTGGQFDSLPNDVKAVAQHFQNEFKKYGIEEGLISKEEADGIYTYVNHMLSPEGKKYFDNVEQNVSVKNPINKNAIERTSFPKDWSIEKINKFMLEEHEVEHFMEDQISRIYLQRSLAHNKYMFDKKRVDDFINTFGKKYDFSLRPEKGDKEGLKAYMAMVNDFQSKKGNGYSIVTLDNNYKAIDVTMLEGKSLEDAMKHNINASPFIEVDPKDLKNESFYESANQPLYVVPSDMHKEYLDIMQGQYKQNTNALLGAYSKFMNLWKAQALLSTGYHVNNLTGNAFNGYLNVGSKILSPKYNAMSGAILAAQNSKGIADKVIMGKKASEWLDIAREYGVLGHTQTDVDMKAFRTGKTDALVNTDSKLKKTAMKLNPFNISHSAGNVIEEQARLTNFLIHMESGKSAQEASDMVNKFLFDYSDLSSFEQNVMKNIMPFYTWFRKNLPLQLSQVFEQPTKYGRIYKGQKAISKPESEEQKKLRPDYLESALHLGEGKYVNVNLPYNDIKKATSAKELISSSNPFAKLALELATNKNIYFDSPIAKQKGEMVKAPKLLSIIAKDTPQGKMMDAKLKYTLDNLLPTLKNASKVADGDTTPVTGLKVYNTDTEKLRQQAIYDYIQKLKDAEANAKKEGKVTKTAEQIEKEEASQKAYEKLMSVYQSEYEKRQKIYNENYVIKKKK